MTVRLEANSLVALDAGVLGLVTNPSETPEPLRCKNWLSSLMLSNVRIAIPEIVDYEVRRELLRADKMRGLRTLDVLKSNLFYVPITTEMMLKAAELWAQMRKQGKPTASPDALDGDVILAAQALVIGAAYAYDPVIATTNVGHLSRMVTAERWQNIAL